MVITVVGIAGARAETAPTSSPYSQVVDNTTEGRFKADESWGTSSYGRGVYDDNYRFARPAEDGTSARFKVRIPETADYAVYARWPEVKGLNRSALIGVETTSGVEWTRIDQQRDGGRWVRIGVFEMEAGDDYSIGLSPETGERGYIAADAVKVEKVSTRAASPEVLSESNDSDGDSRGEDVVKEARKHMGVPYRLGRASRSGMDCSGLTMLVYRKFDITLPHDVERQYRRGERVRGEPKAGDLVFFDEHGDGISHVGIATGRGTIIHASDYWKKVTETKIKHIKGYKGAKRLL